ncbi:MAG TPA: restriction endonuclease [Ignavibacteria bacterium]
MVNNFLDKLIDWREFEDFVKNLYAQEGSFVVERNVLAIGNSGARRQIDVKLTHKTLFHEYITIIECKRWRKKISRSLIDVLHATIEDLNASKGVMFTTTGYEVGATEYAKSKNIDLYLVRDLTEEEWGLPGREIRIYFRMFAGNFNSINIPNTKVAFFSAKVPTPKIDLGIEIYPNQEFKENLYLFSNITNTKGKHLLNILFDTRISILEKIAKNYNFNDLKKNEFKIGFNCDICLDFSNYEFCILNYPEYVVWLDKLYYNLSVSVNQFKFQHDRGNRFDFALIVENYINKSPNVVSKTKQDVSIKIDKILKKEDKSEKVLENDSGVTVYCEPWVIVKFDKDIPIVKVDVDIIDLNKFYRTI